VLKSFLGRDRAPRQALTTTLSKSLLCYKQRPELIAFDQLFLPQRKSFSTLHSLSQLVPALRSGYIRDRPNSNIQAYLGSTINHRLIEGLEISCIFGQQTLRSQKTHSSCSLHHSLVTGCTSEPLYRKWPSRRQSQSVEWCLLCKVGANSFSTTAFRLSPMNIHTATLHCNCAE